MSYYEKRGIQKAKKLRCLKKRNLVYYLLKESLNGVWAKNHSIVKEESSLKMNHRVLTLKRFIQRFSPFSIIVFYFWIRLALELNCDWIQFFISWTMTLGLFFFYLSKFGILERAKKFEVEFFIYLGFFSK